MIIAEIGWNFLGDLKLAKKMVDSAVEAGCKYIKFQIWDPKNLIDGPWDKEFANGIRKYGFGKKIV